MLLKGIIIKIEETHLIVLNGEGVFEKIQKKENAQIGQKIFYTAEDCIKTINKDNVYNFQLRKIVFVAAMFVFVVLLSNFFSMKTDISLPNEISIATIMTIDINPSVKLALDEDDKVLEVTAINKDASTLDFSGIVGLTAADAVEKIVALALNAGFIDSEDLIDDYVLITTISLLENSNQELADSQLVEKQPITSNPHLDELKVKIEEKVANSEVLRDVNVAIIKATKVDLNIAEEKHVPVGLYVVKGNIVNKGENSTVKEYFSHQDQVDAFKNKGVLIQQDKEAKLKLINSYIEKLRFQSYDVSSLENALNQEGVNPDQILEQIRVIWKQFETSKHNNQNGANSTDPTNNEDEKGHTGNNNNNNNNNSIKDNNNHSNKDNNSNNSNSHGNDNKTDQIDTTEIENSTIETNEESSVENGSHGHGNKNNLNNNPNTNNNDNHNTNYHDSIEQNSGRKK